MNRLSTLCNRHSLPGLDDFIDNAFLKVELRGNNSQDFHHNWEISFLGERFFFMHLTSRYFIGG